MAFRKPYYVHIKEKDKQDIKQLIQATVQPQSKKQNESIGFFESGGMYIATDLNVDLNIYGDKHYYLELDNQFWHIKEKKKYINVLPHFEYTAYLENNDDRFRPKPGGNSL